MKLIKHNEYIFEYQNVIDSALCDTIIKNFFVAYQKNINLILPNNSRNNIRNNSSVSLTGLSKYSEDFRFIDDIAHSVISECHHNYVHDNKLFFYLLKTNYIKKLQSEYIFRYYNSSDYYDWHLDVDENKRLIFSYILYLNDNYLGGNTLFLKEKLKVSPKKGSILCFPCDITLLHKSTKIQRGQKNIIWAGFSKIS